MAEFAIILPVLLIILLIAVDFGRLFFTYIEVNNAAREAANYAATHAVDYQNGDATYQAYYDGITAAAVQETNAQSQTGAIATMAVGSPACFSLPSTPISCASAPETPLSATGIGNQVTVTVTQPFTFFTPLMNAFFGGQLDLSASATAAVLNPGIAKITGPTPSPTATVTAQPTPPPGECTVPNFYHTYWSTPPAVTTWEGAGFTGNLIDDTNGHQIQSQTLAALSWQPCSSDMTVSSHP